MKPEKARELAVVLIHLALFSELGVLTRIYLDRFFSGACSGSFGVCLTSNGTHHRSLGAYFPDLPSNMLGSFLMGLFAAGGVLGLSNDKELAILPENSSWQAAPELHIGLRTGYCGSLTTFASWEYSLVTGLIGGLGKQGGQWAEFLWGLIIGLQLSLASYIFGQHCALCIDYYLVPGGSVEADLEEREREQLEEIPDIRMGRPSRGELALERDYDMEGRASGEDRRGDDDTWLGRHSQPTAIPEGDGAGLENGHQAPSSLNIEANGTEADGKPNGKSSQGRPSSMGWVGEFFWQDSGKFPFHRKTNLAAIAMTGMVTALFIVLMILDREPRHQSRRSQWLAVLFGPFGCTLRWVLSKTNYRLPGKWSWLPVGTLAANMLACLIDYIVGGVSSQVGHVGYWGSIVTYAIRTGFCGALSTVSTFVAEVQVQLRVIPERLRGYYYSIGSLALGALLGVIVYGAMVWTS